MTRTRVEGLPRPPAVPAPRTPARLPLDDRVTLRPASRPPRVEPVVGVPAAAGLVRDRLTALLDRVVTARICAVVAPAGAGKTTALAHWAERRGVDVAWFRAAAGGDDPAAALLRGVAAAVQAADPRLPRATGWDTLVDVCGRRERPLVLVVDDLHLLAPVGRPDAAAVVGAVLEQVLLETDGLHLVVAGRVPPPLNMARTELASAVVGPAELRFRPAETAALFRDHHHLPLSDPDARLLTRRTDGWAAALQLFHHTVAGGSPEARHRAVRALGRHDEYARDYLARTVLADLAPEDLVFLQSTATLETLTGPLCDGLLGIGTSHERLLELARHGVLGPSGSGEGYCLPVVVRSHLLAAMRAGVGDRVTDEWFRATATVLTDHGDGARAAAAVRARAAAGDWDEAARTAREHWAAVVADPDLAWADDAPPDAGAAVLAARALRAWRDGRLGDAAAWASSASALEPGPDDPVARTARELVRSCRTWTAGDLQPDGRWGDYVRAALRRPAPDRRTPLDAARGDVLRAVEHAVAGSWTQARRLLEGGAERLTDDAATSCAAELLAAALGADPERADAAAARAEALGLCWTARVGDRLAAGLRGTAPAAPDGVSEADDRGDPWGALVLAGIAAVQRLHQGRAPTEAFEALVGRCRDLDAPALEAWARAGAALGAAAAQEPDAARDAESAIGFAHSAQVPGALAVAYAAAGLAGGDPRMRLLAEDEAERVGLGVRPWEWVTPPAEAAGVAVASRRPPPLEVRCFGGYEVRVDGAVPDLARVRPRARALLRLLSLHAGQPVHREVIVEAMWPRLDGAAATHNLHVCVSGLRSALEPGAPRGGSRLVVRDGERYLLALPDGSVSDLRLFDELLAAAERRRNAGAADDAVADLEAALRLCTGDVLPEDGPTEWVLPHREQYKVRAAEAAALLGRLHLERGRPADAAAAARRSIDIDPCRDASWRLLVAAHVAAGDLAASEEARRSYAEVLASLGVVTSTATALNRAAGPG